MEKLEKAADGRHANLHDLVCHNFLLFSDPFLTASTDLGYLILDIQLLQEQVVAAQDLMDTMLWVVHSQCIHQWDRVTGSASNEEHGSQNLLLDEVD
jgi:hypothetical protein